MACKPVIEGNPEVTENDLTFSGHCTGKCENGGDECQPVFSLANNLPGKPPVNKNAKVTASGTGGGHAFIRITADDDIDNGEVQLTCYCGGKQSGGPETYYFTAVHRTTLSDVLKVIVTVGVSAIVKKITG